MGIVSRYSYGFGKAVRLAMSDDCAKMREIAGAFKALGHPVRLALLRRMMDGEPCVTDLKCKLEQSQPSISQHLGVLRDRGIIEPVRKGNKTCYRVRDERVYDLLKMGAELFGRE